MVCPTCKQNKEREDFYWRRNNPKEKTHYSCKVCERERQRNLNRNKALAKKDFLYAYFH